MKKYNVTYKMFAWSAEKKIVVTAKDEDDAFEVACEKIALKEGYSPDKICAIKAK